MALPELLVAQGQDGGQAALYHHFKGGKPELFRRVVQHVHEEVAARIDAAAPQADAWTQLVEGCRTFLEATAEEGIQRILLLDAPAVLGWDVWRGMDAATSMRHLESALRQLGADGIIEDLPVAPLVHLLSGAMNEAALAIAHAERADQCLADTTLVLEQLLGSLRTVP